MKHVAFIRPHVTVVGVTRKLGEMTIEAATESIVQENVDLIQKEHPEYADLLLTMTDGMEYPCHTAGGKSITRCSRENENIVFLSQLACIDHRFGGGYSITNIGKIVQKRLRGWEGAE